MTAFNAKMSYELIEDGINAILTAEAVDNGFELVKNPVETFAAEDIARIRKVYAYFISGTSPVVDNPDSGDTIKETYTFKIDLAVALKATQEVSGIQDAEFNANQNMNDFIRRVWQSLMQGSSKYLNTDVIPDERFGIISNRRIPNITKTAINQDSGHAIMLANLDITCETSEEPVSIVGVPVDSIDIEPTLTSDPTGTTIDTAEQGTTNPTPAP